jgi:ABC-2 type transport system ATP-binding protein
VEFSIECRKLCKAYGYVPALRELNLSARPGELVALIGDNGAGKSTLLKVLATLLRPDSGACSVMGHDLASAAPAARAAIGYLGHESMLDRVLTLRENLRMFAELYGAPVSYGEELIERLAARPYADNPVGELSRGQEQAAALGRCMVHRPAVLLLDEPFNALDPEARKRLAAILKEEAGRGATVLFSTHDVQGAESIASRVVKMSAGRVI